jgi:type I restriction enzyme R subunit
MTNFEFLLQNEKYKSFVDSCLEAEQAFHASFKAVAVLSRSALETAVKWVYSAEGIELPGKYSLKTLVDHYRFAEIVESKTLSRLRFLIRLGNSAAHENNKISREDAVISLATLFEFIQWIDYCYGDHYAERKFDESLLVERGKGADGRKEKVNINQLNEEIEKKEKEKEALLSEIKILSDQLQADRSRNQQARSFNPDEISEFETRRRYIDLDIQDAGFIFGEDCIREVEVSPMPNAQNKGYADYVLYGLNKKPIAIIEAKKTSVSLEQGVHQAKLYADALEKMYGQRPVIFLANGNETWLWDDGAGYPKRNVYAVFTRDEIELLIQRRTSKNSLDHIMIEDCITNRYYQKLAVKEACEVYKNKGRNVLWVMATGSGKTRTAISLVDVLSKANWIKNVLFLADRTALVGQAKQSFSKLLPNMSLCNLVSKSDEDYNPNARIVFSTYQTMINAIDSEKTENGKRLFTCAHFDLIIIDEAHRSIFKKFKAIFSYFDAMLLGMTATPKSDIDKNTYEFFNVPDNKPTFDYPYRKAVDEDRVLVDYHNIEVKTKFLEQGITYDELSPEDKAAYEETFGDEDYVPEHIGSEALNNWLFNSDTIDRVIVTLMDKGLKISNGDKLGKTIIFAANHDHAVAIKDRFDKLYPALSGDFSSVIDNRVNYAGDLIDKFKAADKFPQVAISVDMLDTGIDVMEILNLVFFKKVRSKSKFWQMIGRGTRLCEDIFGPGMDKKVFYIFDYCGNFEFFRENKNLIETKVVLSSTERIFILKAKIIMVLQDLRFTEKAYQDFRSSLIEDLRAAIKALPMENFAVKEQRVYIEKYSEEAAYMDLTEKDITILSDNIACLIISTDPDEKAKTFDVAMYALMYDVLTGEEKEAGRLIKRTIKVAKELSKKGTIPQVLAKKDIIERVQTSSFWEGVTLFDIENVRVNLRDLLQFLDTGIGKVYVNFQDEVLSFLEGKEAGEPIYDYETADEDYKNKVNQYVNTHRDHIAIYKLMNNIILTRSDYSDLEKILWYELGTKEQYEKEFQDTALGELVRKITGLTQEAANDAFSEFLNNQTLTAPQMNYIKTIIDYVVRNGYIKDNSELAEQPFTTIGRITELFPLQDAQKIMGIIKKIKENAVSVAG